MSFSEILDSIKTDSFDVPDHIRNKFKIIISPVSILGYSHEDGVLHFIVDKSIKTNTFCDDPPYREKMDFFKDVYGKKVVVEIQKYRNSKSESIIYFEGNNKGLVFRSWQKIKKQIENYLITLLGL